ncbi:MAG TPA: GC-type dockerin domain-anchored protein, partial [Phycisphaerales bacterium]|nr:GC-type dockerin domain-anchored protein [Phycisphaerales bacterium]
STTFDTSKWTGIEGAQINTLASGTSEPSAPNSVDLDGSSSGGDVIRTGIMDLRNYVGLTLTYYYERTGSQDSPETNDDLVVDYLNANSQWVELSRQLGSGPDQTTFNQVVVPLPAGVKHANARFRFRVISSQNGADDWFVDNISITGTAEQPNNTCPNADFLFPGSYAFDNLGADTDGPAEGLCNTNGSNQITDDIWYIYVPDCTGNSTTTASVCGSSFNTRIGIYTDCPDYGGTILACNDDFCGTSSSVTFPTTDQAFYMIRVGGFNGAKGSGTLVLNCVPDNPPCAADIAPQPTPDGTVNIDDLTAVILAWGTNNAQADVNHSGSVDIDDLTAIILSWGACP